MPTAVFQIRDMACLLKLQFSNPQQDIDLWYGAFATEAIAEIRSPPAATIVVVVESVIDLTWQVIQSSCYCAYDKRLTFFIAASPLTLSTRPNHCHGGLVPCEGIRTSSFMAGYAIPMDMYSVVPRGFFTATSPPFFPGRDPNDASQGHYGLALPARQFGLEEPMTSGALAFFATPSLSCHA